MSGLHDELERVAGGARRPKELSDLSDAIAMGVVKGLTLFAVGAAIIVWLLEQARRLLFS